MMPRFFCFYTEGTPYQDEAARTVASFAPFGVNVTPIGVKPAGDWMKNCMLRAPLLWDLARKYSSESVGMLDADVRCVADPVLLKDFNADVAAHFRGPLAREKRRYCAGVVVFGPSMISGVALAKWAQLCTEDPLPQANIREQVYLTRAIEHARVMGNMSDDGFNFVDIGEEYNYPGGGHKPGCGAVLVHYEVSRYYVKKVGGKLNDPSQEQFDP